MKKGGIINSERFELVSHEKISKLPPVAIGYISVVLFWVASFIDTENDPNAYFGPLMLITHLISYGFWLFCVFRFHRILKQVTAGSYAISPWVSVGFHFIPIINLWWLIKWPREFSRFIRAQGTVGIWPGTLIGVLLLISTLVRFFDGGISLFLIFSLGIYLRSKLTRYLEATGHLPLRETADEKSGRPRWVLRLGIAAGTVVGVALLLLMVVVIGTETGHFADPDVVPVNKIHPRQVRKLQEMGVIQGGENVQYFYSGAFFSIRGDGNLFTDQRVISYAKYDGELEISNAYYDEVESIDFFPAESWSDDSIIEVTLKDQSWFSLYVSTNEGGDVRFYERLVRMWENKRNEKSN